MMTLLTAHEVVDDRVDGAAEVTEPVSNKSEVDRSIACVLQQVGVSATETRRQQCSYQWHNDPPTRSHLFGHDNIRTEQILYRLFGVKTWLSTLGTLYPLSTGDHVNVNLVVIWEILQFLISNTDHFRVQC